MESSHNDKITKCKFTTIRGSECDYEFGTCNKNHCFHHRNIIHMKKNETRIGVFQL